MRYQLNGHDARMINMRMYILALKDKISFAQRILEDIPDLKIISRVKSLLVI